MAASTSASAGPSSGTLAACGIALLVAATVILGEMLPDRRPPAVPAADNRCLEWSDGCRVCREFPEGPTCSLPGIACVAGQMRCTRRPGG